MPLPECPEIRTTRVVVRPVARADLADLLEVNGDDEVTRFLPYATWRGPDDASAWLARMEALCATGTARQLVFERRSDRKVIGTVLLFHFDEPSARVELGYVVGRACWRQGYAREALQTVCRHAFEEMSIRRIEAEARPDNVASNELLLALGFTHEGRLRGRWVAKGETYDTNIYGCLVEDWLNHWSDDKERTPPTRAESTGSLE
jgi:RimJ/RimL family protein N-acetyltransferase